MMKAIDPVCGMEVESSTALWKTELRNTTQYFCSPVCKRTFDENIDKVLDIEFHQRSHPGEESN
ncbi:MAG: YHS domain-containing protein [Anaerolineales bacterium]|nr:YHS domain-containing protein [Anaerolineales bacterium]